MLFLYTLVYGYKTMTKFLFLIVSHSFQNGKLQDANIIFNQGLPKIFGVPKYAAVLTEICKSRGITVNLNHNLVEVRHDKKEAVYKLMDKEKPEYVTFQVIHCSA